MLGSMFYYYFQVSIVVPQPLPQPARVLPVCLADDHYVVQNVEGRSSDLIRPDDLAGVIGDLTGRGFVGFFITRWSREEAERMLASGVKVRG